MNKAALKRMTRRTEFYMFLVLIILIAVVAVISKGALFEPTQIVTILRAMVVDGMFALCCLVVTSMSAFKFLYFHNKHCFNCIPEILCFHYHPVQNSF